MGRVIALINSAEVLPISFFVFGRWPGALTRLPAVTCDRDCDKDTPERAGAALDVGQGGNAESASATAAIMSTARVHSLKTPPSSVHDILRVRREAVLFCTPAMMWAKLVILGLSERSQRWHSR